MSRIPRFDKSKSDAPSGNVIVIVSAAPRSVPSAGIVNPIVWLETSLGAEFDKVSLILVMVAAFAKFKDGKPNDQNRTAKLAITATALSTRTDFSVRNILYVEC